MPVSPSEYEYFLRPGSVASIGIDLPDRAFAEDLATVIASDADGIMLRLCGNGFPAHLQIACGAKVVISSGADKTLFFCTAQLTEVLSSTTFRVNLPEKALVRDRREHLRTDVLLPVNYYLPASQNMERVIAKWESMRNCSAEGFAEGAPLEKIYDSRVNLGGNGLRFKIGDCLQYGTLLHVNIALPGATPTRIHAVGSIIRTKELLPEMNRVEYYSTAMTFRLIASNDRQKLLHYIFAAQHNSHATPLSDYRRTA